MRRRCRYARAVLNASCCYVLLECCGSFLSIEYDFYLVCLVLFCFVLSCPVLSCSVLSCAIIHVSSPSNNTLGIYSSLISRQTFRFLIT